MTEISAGQVRVNLSSNVADAQLRMIKAIVNIRALPGDQYFETDLRAINRRCAELSQALNSLSAFNAAPGIVNQYKEKS